jgi:hypothetical protein
LSFASGTSFNGYTVLGSASINPAGGSSALVSGVTYNLGAGVATGNEIGVLAFANSTTQTIFGILSRYSLVDGQCQLMVQTLV